MGDVEGPSKFGELVKRARLDRNLSQARLAKLAGLSNGHISLIETGKRGKEPRRDVVLAIAQALNYPAIDMLRAAGKVPPEETLSGPGRPSFAAFVRSDPLLRADQKEVLIDMYAVLVRWTGE